MGKIIETKINRFDGGIVNDLRETDARFCQMVKHFDILSKKHSLIPYRDSEDGSSGGDTDGISQFLFYGTKVFALGHTSLADDFVKVFSMSTFTGNTWTALTRGVGATLRSPDVFVEYKGYAYGWANTTGTTWRIWKCDLADVQAFTENSNGSTTYTISTTASAQLPQPVVHSKDDILYFAYDNIILKNAIVSAPTDVWSTALTLPSKYIITSMCEYGNYLAIACKTVSGLGNSVVYLWDRNASLTTLSESIDWGVGAVSAIEQIEGYLVGVSSVNGSSVAGSFSAFNAKLVFRAYGGSGAQVFREIDSSTNSIIFKHQQKANGRLLFGIGTTVRGENFGGIVSVHRNKDGLWAISMDRITTNTDSSSVSTPQGFALINDFMFISYKNASNVWTVSKTNDSANYTATSIYETLLFNGGDSSLAKKLLGVTVTTEALTGSATVILAYKKDNDSSYTTIFSNNDTTTNPMGHDAVNIESTGVTLPENYSEIQFKITSTGGAIITSLVFKEEVIDNAPY